MKSYHRGRLEPRPRWRPRTRDAGHSVMMLESPWKHATARARSPARTRSRASRQLARARRRLGIDTEFMSEGRYRALLCLVQVAVDDPERVDGRPRIVADRRARASVDATPLAELLADPAIEIVLHAGAPGRRDPAPRRGEPRSRTSSTPRSPPASPAQSAQAGYGNLLGAMLGRRVGKTASYTRWDARPLTAEQLSYARRGRRAPARARRRAPAPADARAAGSTGRARSAAGSRRATDERDPETAWERLPRVGQLDPRARAVARELAAWRERTASDEDRPVGSVLRRPGARRARQAPAAERRRSSSRSAASTRRRSQAARRRDLLEAIAARARGRADPARRARAAAPSRATRR